MLQNYLDELGFTPVIHFELEGCYHSNRSAKVADFTKINQQLKTLNIDGKLIAEYWHKQWEYVSLFHRQSPLKEADNLTKAIQYLPKMFAQQGIERTLIKPVVWAGDKGRLAPGCNNVFSIDESDVHIPNAIQMNISVNNQNDENMVCFDAFGEYLQQCFMNTSLSCCLFFLPEEEAFDRFALTTKFGLANELCSPNDISGGHQGSIALYKEIGKHNQKMGEEPLLFDHQNNVISSQQSWQKTARIEHRLGASSVHYNAYLNIIYGLLNIIDAVKVHMNQQCEQQVDKNRKTTHLPLSLHSTQSSIGAIELFEQDTWFAQRINEIEQYMTAQESQIFQQRVGLGDELKAAILSHYKLPSIIIK